MKEGKVTRFCRLLVWVLMISSCILTLTSGQHDHDWTSECSHPCTCLMKNAKQTAMCSDQDRIPTTLSKEVQSIELMNNKVVSLGNSEFTNAGLEHLHHIHLQNNKIWQIDPLAFNGLKGLISIDLSSNQLYKIDLIIFEPLVSLKEIKLAGNNISRLIGTFPSSVGNSLELLDLSSCKLENLPSNVFDNLLLLSKLDLSKNLFHVLSVDLFKPLTKLTTLNLISNPFNCNCHLRELHSWCTNKFALKTTCKEYSSNSNRKFWEDMTKDDFNCPPNVTTFRIFLDQELDLSSSTNIISSQPGSDIILECHIEADPYPVVHWYKGKELLFNTTTNLKNSKYEVYSVQLNLNTATNLTIKDINVDDIGNYECVGENVGGINRKGSQLLVSSVATGSVGSRIGKNKLWLWILLGLLGFLLLLGIVMLIICICLRKTSNSNKNRQVSDIKSNATDQKSFETIKDYKENVGKSSVPLLLEKETEANVSSNQYQQQTSPEQEKLYEDLRRNNVTDSRAMTPLLNGYDPSTLGRAHTPMPQGYLSGSQVFSPQLVNPRFHPGVVNPYASYDPRRQQSLTLNYRQPSQHQQYGRLYSPFSGSVASFTSEPPAARVYPGPAYVTLPRRRRLPSDGNYYPRTPVPPSPTGSLPAGPIPNLRYHRYQHTNIGPRYDTVGPRTTADGGSNLSLNKVGLVPTVPAVHSSRTPAGLLTPMTPSTPTGSGRIKTPTSGRIYPLHHHVQPNHFNFDTIEEESKHMPENGGPSSSSLATADSSWQFHPINPNDSISPGGGGTVGDVELRNHPSNAKKILPAVPPKPKRKSAEIRDSVQQQPNNLEQPQESATTDNLFSIQGTEV